MYELVIAVIGVLTVPPHQDIMNLAAGKKCILFLAISCTLVKFNWL